MRILNVAFPFAPVTSGAVGGAEQVLARIDEALVHAGHRSFVLACEGSRVSGFLYETPLPRGGIIDPCHVRYVHELYRHAICDIVERDRIDLVHYHGLDFLDYALCAHPALATLHLPLDWYPPALIHLPSSIRLVCVSQHQHDGAIGRFPVHVICNGVLVPPAPRPERKNFCLTLGRICPEKGIHHAVEACRMADVPLVIAGKAFPYAEHLAYLEQSILPFLETAMTLIGPVEGEDKTKLLQQTRALLVPSLAPETSSLVAMEAAACGTPVIAFPSGALPEIVENGVTGFLVQDATEMARAIRDLYEIDSQACRRKAEREFSAERMCAAYLEKYAQIITEAGR